MDQTHHQVSPGLLAVERCWASAKSRVACPRRARGLGGVPHACPIWLTRGVVFLICGGCFHFGTPDCAAQKISLVDGRTLAGKETRTSGIADNPANPRQQAGEVLTQPILVVDDELRRVYVAVRQVTNVLEEAPEALVKIQLWQPTARGGGAVASVGPSLGITPFDKYGRRTYAMQTSDGPLSVVQGITELTARYARVEALSGGTRPVVWDMRLATSSIPLDTLDAILHQWAPSSSWESRLQIVRFYVQAQRFHAARRELEAIVAEFPQAKDLDAEVRRLRQSGARRVLDEIKLRVKSGQYRLTERLLDNFPADEVAGETLEQVREMIDEQRLRRQRIEAIRSRLRGIVDQIADPDDQVLVGPVVAEITSELSEHNVERLAPFVQLLDDPSLGAEQKGALAVSGWILGQEAAVEKLSVAVSLVRVREGVLRYLNASLPHDRKQILDSVRSMEGASVDKLAQLVGRIKPPLHDERAIAEQRDGLLERTAPGATQDGDFRYWVQLPPEYSPYRRYPALVVLNGAYNTPLDELDFWAGSAPDAKPDAKPAWRNGQAMRHGYVVLAVEWQKPHQYAYEFSGREHAAILTSLRDATRRVHIDADRVFLTGHGMGGEAAMDVALAHPDLWAGAIPFVIDIEKYNRFYWENARHVPLYFVAGELDGRRMVANAPVLDKCLKRSGCDTTVVEYLGRGHEPFHDEILALFDWMGRRVRGASPREFSCSTLRPWDNFFWWLECGKFPEKLMVHPTQWNDARPRPATVSGKILADNRLHVQSPAEQTTIWLSPDVIDFDKPIRLVLGRKTLRQPTGGIAPDPETLLEDVRTRSDRQRPFWAKVSIP